MPRIFITDRSDAAPHIDKLIPRIAGGDYGILITKDPQGLYDGLMRIIDEKKITYNDLRRVLVQVSITGLGGTMWEPNVPAPTDAFAGVQALLGLLQGRVALRYDPIIPGVNSEPYPKAEARQGRDAWFEGFCRVAASLRGESMGKAYGVLGVTASVMDLYNHSKQRIIERGLEVKSNRTVTLVQGGGSHPHLWHDDWKGLHHIHRLEVIDDFIAVATRYGLTVRVCCEQGRPAGNHGCDWVDYVAPEDVIESMPSPFGNHRTQFGCRCPKYDQALDYSDRCPYGCAYCYRK